MEIPGSCAVLRKSIVAGGTERRSHDKGLKIRLQVRRLIVHEQFAAVRPGLITVQKKPVITIKRIGNGDLQLVDAHGYRRLHGELDVIAKRLAVHTEMLGFKQVGHIGGFCDLIFDKQLEFFHDNLLKENCNQSIP